MGECENQFTSSQSIFSKIPIITKRRKLIETPQPCDQSRSTSPIINDISTLGSCDLMDWRCNFISTIFFQKALPQFHHEKTINPNWGTLDKITDQYSSKVIRTWKTDWGTVTDNSRLRSKCIFSVIFWNKKRTLMGKLMKYKKGLWFN